MPARTGIDPREIPGLRPGIIVCDGESIDPPMLDGVPVIGGDLVVPRQPRQT